MFEDIKHRVYLANLELVNKGLVIYTWGNASEISADRKFVVIKPSGVNYNELKPEDMVVINLETSEIVEGKLRPSSDTPTHLELYKSFQNIGGIVHTHSINAVAFAQAGLDVPALGTTHADYFSGDIPCTRELNENEVLVDYEKNTGKVIVETFLKRNLDPLAIPGVVVKNHGPFTWGKNSDEAVYNSVVLETVAEMDIKTIILNRNSEMNKYILEKHYERKHGVNAYYGQKK